MEGGRLKTCIQLKELGYGLDEENKENKHEEEEDVDEEEDGEEDEEE